MGRFATLLVVGLAVCAPAFADDEARWTSDFDGAIKTAKAGGKPILVYVLDGD